MPRDERGSPERGARRQGRAKGYFGRKHSSYRLANEQVMRSTPTRTGTAARASGLQAALDHQDQRRRPAEGMSYSELIHGLQKADVEVNRKMLADIAVNDPDGFRRFVESLREAAASLAEGSQTKDLPGGPRSGRPFSFGGRW